MSKTPYIEYSLDPDLEKMLDQLWQKDPHPTATYLNLRAKLMIVQELRTLNTTLAKRRA